MRRPVATIVASTALLGLLLGLTACGDQDDASSDAVGQVEVTGTFGSEPEVTWNGEVDTDELASKTLIEGTGEKLASGDTAVVQVWIGNGFTQDQAYSSYDQGGPSSLSATKDMNEWVHAALEDQTVGSRILVVAPPKAAFGDEGNPQMGIGNEDDVVFVVDILSKVLDAPEGDAQTVPEGTPSLVEKDGKVTGFDFTKSPKQPSAQMQVVPVIKGTGPVVKKGDSITINYLGQIYGTKTIFDQTYDKGAPTSFVIGTGQLIPGWDEGLVGQTVGSRVILVLPPDKGYGKAGNTSAGIKGTDTLVFVVDILAAN